VDKYTPYKQSHRSTQPFVASKRLIEYQFI